MLLSEPCCRRVMTTLVRPNAVCLSLNDRNVECVCKEGQINFFHSVLYVCVLFLSYLEIHCNLSFSEIEDLEDFFSIFIWILIHTSRILVGFLLWHSSLLYVTSRPFLCVCVCVHHLFGLWLLVWVIMCTTCVYFTAWHRRGSPPTWGCSENVTVWLCSALWHSLYSTDDFSPQVWPSALSAWNQEW